MEKDISSTQKGKRIALIVLCGVLALILVGVVVMAVLGQSLLNRINRIDPDEETLSSEQLESVLGQTETLDPDYTGDVLEGDELTSPTQPAETIPVGENIFNILLVGQDRREGEGRRHSDSTILITVNKSAKTLTMTSFMRDLWVYIPYGSGGFEERINCAYMVGGFKTLNATLEHNFGVSSGHNVEVDFEGFQAIIDKIGGIDLELTAAEANYLNKNGNWGVDDDKSWTLQAGMNHMTGSQALAYSRIRAIGNDQGRTNRQRTVLTELINKAKNMDIVSLYGMVNELLPMVTTDMDNSEILGYVLEIAPLLPELTIVSQRIPADGAYSAQRIEHNGYIKDVLTMNAEQHEKNIELLKDSIGGE